MGEVDSSWVAKVIHGVNTHAKYRFLIKLLPYGNDLKNTFLRCFPIPIVLNSREQNIYYLSDWSPIPMHAIVTVIGRDRVGIIAGICVALANINVNVLDISQTILGGMFTMIMLVDVQDASVPFDRIAAALDEEGERLGVNIRIQREDIFNAMHRV